MTDSLPRCRLGPHDVSRLVCGSNPFLGYSYRSGAHSRWQRRHFTPERIAEILEKCLACGINTMLGNVDESRTFPRALDLVETRTGARPHWIAYTCGGPDGQIESIDAAADAGAIACYIQGGTIDSSFQYNYVGGLMLGEPDCLDRIKPWLAHVREKGMTPGIGTHRHQILSVAEERGYDVEFYVHALNSIGVYCSYAESVRAIRSTPKTVIAIKTLGGSAKIRPEDGLTIAYLSIKPSDIVAVGMENEECVEHNAGLVRGLLDIV